MTKFALSVAVVATLTLLVVSQVASAEDGASEMDALRSEVDALRLELAKMATKLAELSKQMEESRGPSKDSARGESTPTLKIRSATQRSLLDSHTPLQQGTYFPQGLSTDGHVQFGSTNSPPTQKGLYNFHGRDVDFSGILEQSEAILSIDVGTNKDMDGTGVVWLNQLFTGGPFNSPRLDMSGNYFRSGSNVDQHFALGVNAMDNPELVFTHSETAKAVGPSSNPYTLAKMYKDADDSFGTVETWRFKANRAFRGTHTQVAFGNVCSEGIISAGGGTGGHPNLNGCAGNGKVQLLVCSMQSTDTEGGHVYRIMFTAHGQTYNDYSTDIAMNRLSDDGLVLNESSGNSCTFVNNSGSDAHYQVVLLPLTTPYRD